eukprot:c43656_g1_i1 orf=141-299(+)
MNLGTIVAKCLGFLSRNHEVKWMEVDGMRGGLAILLNKNWGIEDRGKDTKGM